MNKKASDAAIHLYLPIMARWGHSLRSSFAGFLIIPMPILKLAAVIKIVLDLPTCCSFKGFRVVAGFSKLLALATLPLMRC